MNRQSGHRLGRRAEWAALVLLLFKGYRLRHRNWRGGGGELDLVMQRRDVIVFVEVKARTREDFGGAAAAFTAKKQKALVRTASAYLGHHSLWNSPSRFDLVTIDRRRKLIPWRIRHYQNAFEPDLGRQF